MNQTKKYNRIKYVAQQQDFEGVLDNFMSTGKKISSLATSKFFKEGAKKAASAGVEKFAVSGAEALGKSAADKTVDKLFKPSIIKENKPTPNSCNKIVDVMKKVGSPVQSNEVELSKQQLVQIIKRKFYLNTINI